MSGECDLETDLRRDSNPIEFSLSIDEIGVRNADINVGGIVIYIVKSGEWVLTTKTQRMNDFPKYTFGSETQL